MYHKMLFGQYRNIAAMPLSEYVTLYLVNDLKSNLDEFSWNGE